MKNEIHKQVILEVTQFYGDAESVENIVEAFKQELKSASEVEIQQHMFWISYKFQMDHEIAQRMHDMFKAIFGEGQSIGGGNLLQVEIKELNRDQHQQDYDHIVHGTPYDESED